MRQTCMSIVVSSTRQISTNTVNKEGMNRLPKRMQQAKRVAPPAVPEIYRHSGSSFGSAGYGSCDDSTATTNMGGGSNNFYANANDPNNSLNVSLRSNTSNSSIDLPDNATSRLLQANPVANASGKAIFEFFLLLFYSFICNLISFMSSFQESSIMKRFFHFLLTIEEKLENSMA